ncbi:MAG: putative toxin-antitoxin system toxin component, PIN family [Planctomycetes bacterium]|nr:putative toxin-antitoxin system toxin component, PIN family [Planctomycetota bacterium]
MNSDQRFVFDANVIISALLFNASVPGQAFARCLESGTLLVSQSLIQELHDVLGRAKFNRYVTREERERFLGVLIRESELVQITEKLTVCRDPADDRLLELAVSGRATTVVTGDNDLLVLNPFRGIPIVTAAVLLSMLGNDTEKSDAHEQE